MGQIGQRLPAESRWASEIEGQPDSQSFEESDPEGEPVPAIHRAATAIAFENGKRRPK